MEEAPAAVEEEEVEEEEAPAPVAEIKVRTRSTNTLGDGRLRFAKSLASHLFSKKNQSLLGGRRSATAGREPRSLSFFPHLLRLMMTPTPSPFQLCADRDGALRPPLPPAKPGQALLHSLQRVPQVSLRVPPTLDTPARDIFFPHPVVKVRKNLCVYVGGETREKL